MLHRSSRQCLDFGIPALASTVYLMRALQVHDSYVICLYFVRLAHGLYQASSRTLLHAGWCVSEVQDLSPAAKPSDEELYIISVVLTPCYTAPCACYCNRGVLAQYIEPALRCILLALLTSSTLVRLPFSLPAPLHKQLQAAYGVADRKYCIQWYFLHCAMCNCAAYIPKMLHLA